MVQVVPRILKICESFKDLVIVTKWHLDRSKGSSMADQGQGRLEDEIVKIMLVLSKEEAGWWIYSRKVT